MPTPAPLSMDAASRPASTRQQRFRLPTFALASLLLLAVGVAVAFSIRSFTRSVDWVEHTYQVMSATESVRSATRAVESSARGYRISGRSSMMAEYLTSIPLAQVSSAELVALTADAPAQQRRARELQGLVSQRLIELQRLMDMQAGEGIEAVQRALASSPGFAQMLAINAKTDLILAEEHRLLALRRAAMTSRANALTAGVAAGILLPLLLLSLLMRGLALENRRNQRLERDARSAMCELAISLEERGRLSEQRRVLGAYAGLLQSCQNLDEAVHLTGEVIAQLLPHAGGRCYVIRASQNLAETVACFDPETVPSDSVLAPNSCWALRRGQPHRCSSGPGNLYCDHLHVDSLPEGGWTLCVPLMAQGTSLGLLQLAGTSGGGVAEVELIEAIAEQLSLSMVNLQLRETLRVQSLRDPLTGLYNRRYLEENLQRELLRCERRGLPLSVMVDVDHFKRFNDQHGHAAGDAMLAAVAQTLQKMTREEDITCRYGGEEFTLVLAEADPADALRRCEEIRQAIASTTVMHLRKNLGPATASLGIATFPADARTANQLLELADAALYRAKAQGRNRVVVHEAA